MRQDANFVEFIPLLAAMVVDARRCAAEVLDAVMDFQTSVILKAMREQDEDAT